MWSCQTYFLASLKESTINKWTQTNKNYPIHTWVCFNSDTQVWESIIYKNGKPEQLLVNSACKHCFLCFKIFWKKYVGTNLTSVGARLFPFFSWLTPLGMPCMFKDYVFRNKQNKSCTNQQKNTKSGIHSLTLPSFNFMGVAVTLVVPS